MFRLLKVEFRKARGAMLALCGITSALEIYFLAALHGEWEEHLAIAAFLLVISGFAAAMFVFIRGITSYSRELNSTSGYLLFMTPNSSLKIMSSKYLYTFLNGVVFMVLLGGLAFLDFELLMAHYVETGNTIKGLMAMLRMQGVYIDQFLYAALFIIVYIFLMLLSVVAIAYFSITLSHTLFRDRKWRWLPSLLLFIALYYGIQKLNGAFPSALGKLSIIGNNMFSGEMSDAEVVAEVSDALWQVVIPSLLPPAGVSLGVILASLFGCSALLEKKVSL